MTNDYDRKLIAYGGALPVEGDLFRQAATFNDDPAIYRDVCLAAVVLGSDRMKNVCASILIYEALSEEDREQYGRNDGVVPEKSSLFNDHEIFERKPLLQDFDHGEM